MAGYIGKGVAGVASVSERKKVFTATSGQTAFTPGGGYTVNNVDVFQNGVRLVDGTDYTATDGTTVTLTNGAQLDDEVVIIAKGSYQNSDSYTKAEADAKFIEGDDTLSVDETNNRVGIGTTSPVSSLQVSETQDILSGTSNPYGIHIYPTSSGYAYIDGITSNTSGASITLRSYYNGTYNNIIKGTTDTNTTTFETAGSERLRISSAGYIYRNGYKKYYNSAAADTTVTSFSDQYYDEFGWYLVGNVGMHMASGGKRYIHLKTNLISSSKMCQFKLDGYLYNTGFVSQVYGLYMYTGSSILNKHSRHRGSQTAGIVGSYKASGGELCLIIDTGTTGYTTASARLYANRQGSDDTALGPNFAITSLKRATGTSAQF